jgi:hypothetical protein
LEDVLREAGPFSERREAGGHPQEMIGYMDARLTLRAC